MILLSIRNVKFVQKDTTNIFSYYPVDTILNLDKTTDENYKKYEIESPQLVDSQIVFAANIEKTVAPTSADGFQLLKGFGIISA